MSEWQPQRDRLRGRSIVAVAALPRVEASAGQVTSRVLETEEAIASLIRAVVAEGGSITLVADQSLSLFAGVVAGEYVEPFLEDARERPRPLLSIRIPGGHNDGVDWIEPLRDIGYADAAFAESATAAVREVGRTADALVVLGAAPIDAIRAFRDVNRTNAPMFVLKSTLDPEVNVESLADAIFPDWIAVQEAPLPEQSRLGDQDEREVILPPIALTLQLIVDRLIDESRRTSKG